MATRKFAYDGREFPDPDPSLTPEQVKENMSSFFPELATATISEHKKSEEETIYEFQRKTGTKASRDPLTMAMVSGALRTVKPCTLDLVKIAREVVKPDGSIDEEQLATRRLEIEVAAEQATGYVNRCIQLGNRLVFHKMKACRKPERPSYVRN